MSSELTLLQQGLGTHDPYMHSFSIRGCYSLAVTLTHAVLCRAVQGSMSALPVTLISRSADGSRHFITPPPAHILPQASIEAAQVCWGGASVVR
jgi:hypothetical protein